MKKLRIFVTGSSGFIARNVIEQLGYKYDYIVPTHKQLDLLNSKSVEKFFKKDKYFDFVIHTAIVGGNRKFPNSPEIAIDNMRMFLNVARNETYFGKMIHLGSGIDYAKEKPLHKIKEADFDKYVPQDNYGFYKYICAKYIEHSEKNINLRIFGIFGKYEDASIRFISNSLCKYILKMPITINQNVYFDYLYIDDFVKILDYFLSNEVKHKSYNVGVGKSIDLITIAKKINNLSDHKSPIKVAISGLANEYTCNNQRLLKEIGKFKFTDFDVALRELYDWYFNRRHLLNKKDFLDNYFKK